MARKRLYYPKSEIEGPFYASEGELVDREGAEYIGFYVKAGGQILSGKEIDFNSKLLRVGSAKFREPNATRYFQITRKEFTNHTVPVYFYPEPTLEDYKRRSFTRYFIQKINEPAESILEINEKQYNDWNTVNKVGIDGNLHRRIKFDWTIAGPDVVANNRKVLAYHENIMPGIKRYLSNITEFARRADLIV